MTKAILALALLLTGCATVRERFAASVGVQRFTPADSVTRSYDPADCSAYLNVRLDIGHGWTLQAQPVFPLSGAEPALGLRLDYELPLR